jgi:hypothetical protein
MSDDFWDNIPSIGSVRARLSMFASNTEAGDLNTVLNEAYELIGQYKKDARQRAKQ